MKKKILKNNQVKGKGYFKTKYQPCQENQGDKPSKSA